MDETSIVDYLKSKGVDSSFEARKHVATRYDVPNYTGTAEQNTKLLTALRAGPPSLWQEVMGELHKLFGG